MIRGRRYCWLRPLHCLAIVPSRLACRSQMIRSLLLLLATYAAVLREPTIRANAISVAVLCDSSVPELFNVSRLTEVLSRQEETHPGRGKVTSVITFSRQVGR